MSKEASTASATALDFTNVKDGGAQFTKRRQPAGDYQAKVTKVVEVEAKSDGKPMWLFTISVGSNTYPYYCKLVPEQLWKVRNLLMAAGLDVPKKKVKVNPNAVVGRGIAVTLDDDEYDDGDKVHEQSVVTSTFPLNELDGASADEDDEDEDEEVEVEDDDEEEVVEEEEEDEEEEEQPKPKKKKGKKKRAPEPEVEDDDLEEIDIDL